MGAGVCKGGGGVKGWWLSGVVDALGHGMRKAECSGGCTVLMVLLDFFLVVACSSSSGSLVALLFDKLGAFVNSWAACKGMYRIGSTGKLALGSGLLHGAFYTVPRMGRQRNSLLVGECTYVRCPETYPTGIICHNTEATGSHVGLLLALAICAAHCSSSTTSYTGAKCVHWCCCDSWAGHVCRRVHIGSVLGRWPACNTDAAAFLDACHLTTHR